MRYLLVIAILLLSGACSLYQSEGRKFLEKQALQFAASANLQSCGNEKLQAEWLKVLSTEEAEVYSSENQDFTLRIVPNGANQSFNCTYHFSSVQEMVERTDSAIQLTINQMALGLGEFAFHPVSPLK